MRAFLTILVAVFLSLCTLQSNAQERITFDGYWWGTATWAQKLGYVQGFIDGHGNATKTMGGG